MASSDGGLPMAFNSRWAPSVKVMCNFAEQAVAEADIC